MIYRSGEFYGTTLSGGVNGQGTVFKVSPTGNEKVLYSFGRIPDGSEPQAPLYEFNNDLYGTRLEGGNNACMGCGTIFKLPI